MITVVRFIPDVHYEYVAKWWNEQNWPCIPLSHLSQNGFIAYCNGAPAAAGWLYSTDSAFALMEWIVASPEVRGVERTCSINELIKEIKNQAKDMGFLSVFMNAHNDSLIKRLKENDFQVTDKNMTNLIFNTQGVV